MTQLAFSFDISRCSGCMACIVACLDENDLEGDGPYFRNVTCLEKGAHPSASISFMSLSCMHCGDAPCIMICPTGAIYREENGIVDVDQDLCVGCHSCALACPFGAAHFNPDKGVSYQCDLCDGDPVCVKHCYPDALSFEPTEAAAKRKGRGRAVLRVETALPVAQ